jgi:hypothetical protein
MIDEGFIGRVYKTSACVTAVILLALWAYAVAPRIILGVLAGYLLSVLSLASLSLVITRKFGPGNARVKAKYAGAAALKYLVIGGIIYVVVATDYLSLPAFVGGFASLHAIMVLKVLGAMAAQRLAHKDRPSGGE